MYGHDSLPTHLWTYGTGHMEGKHSAFPGRETAIEQMRLAARYRNALVELELARRAKTDEALRRLSPDLVAAEQAVADAEAALGFARRDITTENARQRARVATPPQKAEAKAARVALKDARARRKALRSALFASEPWTAEQEAINIWTSAEQKRLRAASGLYWGTYLHVEESAASFRRGAPPRFRGWDGGGHLMAHAINGLSVADVFGGDGTLVRIDAPLPPAEDGRKSRRVHTQAWVRVASLDREPVWARFPLVVHRFPPPDARVKRAHLIRRRVGTHYRWSLQLALARAAWPGRRGQGVVGLDVGWRLRPSGELRVAYWRDETGAEGELTLPADWLGEQTRTRRIRSVRDQDFNAARDLVRDVIASWRAAGTLPAWMAEEAATLPQWRAPRRLARLVIAWRGKRFDGDAEAFAAAEAWRKRDRHLYEFEAQLRDQLAGRRRDLYRRFAVDLAKRYGVATMEKMDLRDFHVLPPPEEPPAEAELRAHVRDACLSDLRRCVEEAMAETRWVPAAHTTTLHRCGSMETWDRRSLFHVCSRCGEQYDQDAMAAENLLRAGLAASAPVVTT
jgi:hypothetical protein